jgi:hypothetical protein
MPTELLLFDSPTEDEETSKDEEMPTELLLFDSPTEDEESTELELISDCGGGKSGISVLEQEKTNAALTAAMKMSLGLLMANSS